MQDRGTSGVGHYRVEHVRLEEDAEPQEQLQSVLDRGEGKEWHLVGVAGGLSGDGVLLFWDTTRPSFGKTTRY